jgi:hypothetical protein
MDFLKRSASIIIEKAKTLPIPRIAPKDGNAVRAPRSAEGAAPAIDIASLIRSKPFILSLSALFAIVCVACIVGLLLSRPLPRGRERLPPLTGLAALGDFKLPAYPERFQKIEYYRDPGAAPDPAELASFVYLPAPGDADEARKLARKAVEDFYEGVE